MASMIEIIGRRVSCRSYDGRPLDPADADALKHVMAEGSRTGIHRHLERSARRLIRTVEPAAGLRFPRAFPGRDSTSRAAPGVY
ncbi:MAG: hypothetical protein CVU61_05205 [Deltaproteobacteria bacterium HGW-Deltaproteobacteria-19]|jgi:hypothetical protein|nr:MAG: hypothetical protein CVU61_05205 [Deltaproteobacteria bacterium HGW-Deltaproteobacteria-19]